MTQEQLLEHLWRRVIDRREPRVDVPRSRIEHVQADLQRVARSARYDALFDWCNAYDEAGLEPQKWLEATERHRWKALGVVARPSPIFRGRKPPDDAPFADAVAAMARLFAAGATPAQLQALITRARRLALEGVRQALCEHAFGSGDLGGLHESILSADPSGREGRPKAGKAKGAPTVPPSTRGDGPLVTVRKSQRLVFSPDGRRVVASADGVVTDVATGKRVVTCAFLAHTGSIDWSSDGRFILGCSTAGQIAVCDASTGARAHVIEVKQRDAAVAFSADGLRILTEEAGQLVEYAAATGRELRRLEIGGGIDEIVCDPGGVSLIVARSDGRVYLRLSPDLVESAPPIALPHRARHVFREPDGRHAVFCAYAAVGRIVLRDGAVVERHEIKGALYLAVSADGRCLVVGTVGDGFHVGSCASLSALVALPVKYSAGAAFSADGARVALATSAGGTVWSVDTLLRRRTGW